MLGPILRGERAWLGPTEAAHLPAFLRWSAEPDFLFYLGRLFPFSSKQEDEWLDRASRSETDVIWSIFAGNQLIGSTGLHEIHWQSRHGMSGIGIGDRAFWGQGIATEVMRLRTRYAFEELGLEKVITNAFMENVASRKALERAGYREVGVHRRHYFRHGRWHDVWIGEVLREDWERAEQHTPGSADSSEEPAGRRDPRMAGTTEEPFS